jgi:hypothetical protein
MLKMHVPIAGSVLTFGFRKTKKKLHFGSFLKYKFLCKGEEFLLWPKYIGEMSRTLGKPYYINLRIVNIW